jgi:hypothetical protein
MAAAPGTHEQALVPVDNRSGSGGFGVLSYAADGQFQCRAGSVIGSADAEVWSVIQARASGYATGNCYDGWHVHRTRKEVNKEVWDGGYFFGDYESCGWIRSDRDMLLKSQTYTDCANPNNHERTFAYSIDCHPATAGCAGTAVAPIQVLADCAEYANVRPWVANATPTNYVVTRPAGYAQFAWRYVTRDLRFVMVHDFGHGANEPTWVFVPRSCLAGNLPANPNDPRGKYYP